MPSFCAVVNCNDRYGHSENISFHKFPIKRLDLLKQWEAFIQKQRGEDWHASRWTSLCSRHFRDDDFRSLNERKTLKKTAVPTIICEEGAEGGGEATAEVKSPRKKPLKVVETLENTRDKEFKEILAIKERLQDVGGSKAAGVLAAATVPKTNCRLCGNVTVPVATFLTNYELYGLLQKCFPTLNIQQEDALPKVLCEPCHKNLEEFGMFVDRVWTAQTELQKKFRLREKPVKIKQEPLVRVKQEVAETGYDDHHDPLGGGANEDYEGGMEGGLHEEGDDQKYEFCDFPIINDCDIMEIINLDDPFIDIPDDDNTTTVNEEEENLQKPMQDPIMHYLPTAHELLQSHLLMEEHNYAYIDAEDFKEERQIYKTEKSENDERLVDYTTVMPVSQQTQPLTHLNEQHHFNYPNYTENSEFFETPSSSFENRALKPIVTSVSAIQQPTKSSSNGIVVLNESIVKSGCGFQLHACMVCQLKFFSVESLKQHYTQTHGTPMVQVPTGNITMEKVAEPSCKMEKEFSETNSENSENLENPKDAELTTIHNENDLNKELPVTAETLTETKKETPENYVEQQHPYPDKEISEEVAQSKITQSKNQSKVAAENISKEIVKSFTKRHSKKLKIPLKTKKSQNVSLNTMANQYQQLRKLYQKLQKKCTNLEQNVEQLQLMPPPTSRKKTKVVKKTLNTTLSSTLKNLSNSQISTSINSNRKIPLNKSPKAANTSPSFDCTVCSKSFSNSNSLRQHKITHTEERKHICSLCERCFKRRNGLLQHLKGFHLKVKPFACPVCKHCYALKCDMLRCKHSILKGLHNSPDKLNNKDRLVLKNLDK